MQAGDRIRQRNSQILDLKREAEELVVEFYEDNREKFQEMVERNERRRELIHKNEDRLSDPDFDLEEIEENVPELDQTPKREMEEFVQTQSEFRFVPGRKPLETVEKARKNELEGGRLLAEGREIYDLEMENYLDYFKLVGEEISEILDDNIEAAYIGGGGDFVPAAEIGGDWKYIGLEEERNVSYGDADIEFIKQDLESGELPQISDGSLDLVLIKTPGSVVDQELEQKFLDIAYEKLEKGGMLLTDVETGDISGYRPLGEIEPTPESFEDGLSDPYEGGRVYPTQGLRSYIKT